MNPIELLLAIVFYIILIPRCIIHGLSSGYNYFLVKSYQYRHSKLMESRKVL